MIDLWTMTVWPWVATNKRTSDMAELSEVLLLCPHHPAAHTQWHSHIQITCTSCYREKHLMYWFSIKSQQQSVLCIVGCRPYNDTETPINQTSPSEHALGDGGKEKPPAEPGWGRGAICVKGCEKHPLSGWQLKSNHIDIAAVGQEVEQVEHLLIRRLVVWSLAAKVSLSNKLNLTLFWDNLITLWMLHKKHVGAEKVLVWKRRVVPTLGCRVGTGVDSCYSVHVSLRTVR